jgi:hypothetical protein
MKKLALALIILVTAFLFSNLASADSYCTGWDTHTGAYVSGNCYAGSFRGWNSRTNSYVFGSCKDGGNFTAWDNQTNSYVTGSCR